jgi:hypothetical protein
MSKEWKPDARTFEPAESAGAEGHGSPPPCWVYLDEVVRESDNLGWEGLAHVRQDKLVGDGSAVAGPSPVQAVGHAVTFVETGCSPVLAVGHAVTSVEEHDQDHAE